MTDGQTCSAGVALWDGAETPEELLARADAALYAAKVAGRDRTELASVGGKLLQHPLRAERLRR